jgi:hypothetical protein
LHRLCVDEGDQIGEFSPLGQLFSLGKIFKITQVYRTFWATFSHTEMLAKYGFGNIFGRFFSQTHLVTLAASVIAGYS